MGGVWIGLGRPTLCRLYPREKREGGMMGGRGREGGVGWSHAERGAGEGENFQKLALQPQP